EAPLRRRQAAPARLRRSRTRRLPIPLWWRKGGGGVRLLRASAHPRLQLLPAASRAVPWSGHCVRTHGRSGRAAADQGRLTPAPNSLYLQEEKRCRASSENRPVLAKPTIAARAICRAT